MKNRLIILIVIGVLTTAGALGGYALLGAYAQPADAAPAGACGVVSCTAFLPIVIKNFPIPANLEVTQGVQLPGNPVALIQDRTTFVRYTLTSTTAYAGVNATLYATRDGVPLGSVAALNNPRTLKSTADRGILNDTFNFQLPASWLNGALSLQVTADNGSTFSLTAGAKQYAFTYADPLNVTIVPIQYFCGGTGVLPGDSPYAYVTPYTYQTYPVPSVSTIVHAAVPYTGHCTSGIPDPLYPTDWNALLDLVADTWVSEGYPNRYYYGLVEVYCPSSCIAGYGYIGFYKAAVGFDGFGASHAQASQTHAHEVGHNHGREHAPCDVSPSDPGYPYASARIGDASHPNYGFNISTQAIYAYSGYYDFMSYCGPAWISDYTYEGLRQWNLTDSAVTGTPTGNQSLLISGWIDSSGQATLRPIFALDTPAYLPQAGDHAVELLDAKGIVIAAYPFTPSRAVADQSGAPASYERRGFNLALPYVDGVASIRIRRGEAILGALTSGASAPTLRAGVGALGAEGHGIAGLRVSWSASDADRDRLTYLVRASTDGGKTWQAIGVSLTAPAIDLRPDDFGGKSVLVEVSASDGLHSQSLRVGPFAVPASTQDE